MEQIDLEGVSDVVLDSGRRPCCWHDGRRRYLCDERDAAVVGDGDLRYVASKLDGFGEDDRTGVGRQLHRVSCVRNNKNDIIGMTIRVGR